jgi:hypothetical protein
MLLKVFFFFKDFQNLESSSSKTYLQWKSQTKILKVQKKSDKKLAPWDSKPIRGKNPCKMANKITLCVKLHIPRYIKKPCVIWHDLSSKVPCWLEVNTHDVVKLTLIFLSACAVSD